MKVNGVIAEYNPFHNGHKFHLEESARLTGADYTIIAMSGNFMQRGAPAIIDKYKRAEMALRNGADLVLELPTYYSASSAEFFATGAVSLLDKLGVVTHLCFGSEHGHIDELTKFSDILLAEPEEYVERLRRNMREGLSYPAARTKALLEYCPELCEYRDILSTPNNILGIEYMKAIRRLNSNIEPITTKRVGSDYHDKRLGTNQSSALAIRNAIFTAEGLEFLQNQMPESAYNIMADYLVETPAMQLNDFSAGLHYKLLTERNEGFERYLDINSDLSDRIIKNLDSYSCFQDFCDTLKSKEMTYTRISRCLLHILLNITKDNMAKFRNLEYTPYARILGFRKDSTDLLSAIKQNSQIPLISKLADADKILDENAMNMLQNELVMNSLYYAVRAHMTNTVIQNEYRTPIVIV